MDVSVIIINYNTFQLTYNCIKSVIQNTSGINYEIILVDNASSECRASLFKEYFPKINLIESKENLGFSKGNNLGIKFAKGNYILLLNSDVELKNNAIKITFDYLKNNVLSGVVTARITYPDGSPQSVCQRFPSIRYQLIELFRLHKLFPEKIVGKILLGPFFKYNENIKADWIWGTYFMFQKEILKKLPSQKLNDDFFMYGEDIQWCFDIKNIGYEVHFCHYAEVLHYLGGSNGNSKNLIKQNHLLFMDNNYNFVHRLCIKFISSILHK